MSAALGIAAVLLLTVGTGFFVAQEFAYVSADRVELSRRAEAGDARAASAIRVMKRLSFMLSAAQVGITVTGLLVGFIAEPAFAAAFRPLLDALGLSGAVVTTLSVATGFVLAIAIQMVLGELFPKNLAIARPEQLAIALAPATHAYLLVSGPIVRLFDASANRLLRAVGIEPVEELHHGATLEELGQIIGESEAHGSLPAHLSGVLGRALTFSERTAGEAMVPRPDVVTVSAQLTVSEVVDVVAGVGHSNYPVVGRTTDDVIGVIGVRELMGAPEATLTRLAVTSIARPPVMVPDSLPLPAVVAMMIESNDEFACVVDEYGGLAGIVTLEDIAEELVGEIVDETDSASIAASQRGDWWEIDAVLRVDEASAQTGLRLPESDDYDTVAGLIVAELGRFPEPGDRFTIGGPRGAGNDRDSDHGAWTVPVEVEIVTVQRHVPEIVRLRRLPESAEVQ